MTSEEFDNWTADLCRKFPAIAKWLEGLPDGGLALLEEWGSVLERTPYAGAIAANRRMLAGEETDYEQKPLPGSFASQWQNLPGHIRRLASEFSVPAEPLQYARPERFNCHLCRDTGCVHVASPEAVANVLAGRPIGHHRDAVARCTCRVGQQLQRKHQWETFNDGADFRVLDPLWREPECDRFTAWVYEQRDNGAEARAKAHQNYRPEFAEWSKLWHLYT